MAKSSKTSKQRESSFELLRGGELAEGVVLRRLPALKRQLSAEVNEKSAIQRQAAKYLSQIETPAGSGDSAKEGQAIHGLRQLTEQLAKQKLAAPRRVHLSPDVWASIRSNLRRRIWVWAPPASVKSAMSPGIQRSRHRASMRLDSCAAASRQIFRNPAPGRRRT